MNGHVIGFIKPIIGLEGDFNTFRLGSFYAKRLSPGDTVYLLDEKEKLIIGRAEVTGVETGQLGEMLLIHAAKNHTELENDAGSAPERLFVTMKKIYGPHIATPERKVTVIYCRRIP